MKSFQRLTEQDLAFFEKLLPGRVFSGEAVSEDYDHDEMTEYGHYAPEAVLQALSAEDVCAVLRYCNERNIAVTPRLLGWDKARIARCWSNSLPAAPARRSLLGCCRCLKDLATGTTCRNPLARASAR